MSKIYTTEFLISELHRFYNEKNKVPTVREMYPHYPSCGTYKNRFGSWNNALIAAGFKINQIKNKLIGTEICSYCKKKANEILGFRCWIYDHNGVRYCEKHGQGQDYINGELDINSSLGLGRAGELLVANTLKIANKFDCNRISCNFKIDLMHDKFGKIDVKTSLFRYNYNTWNFPFRGKKDADIYICIGLSSNRKNVEHVWFVLNTGKIRNSTGITISNTLRSLHNRKKYEVNNKSYNDIWNSMKLDNCNIMVDKSKDNHIGCTI